MRNMEIGIQPGFVVNSLLPRATIMDRSIARSSIGQQASEVGGSQSSDLLREDLDDAASESLVANATNPILSDDDPAISASIAPRCPVTKPQLRLLPERKCTPQAGYHASLVDNCVCRPYTALEIRLKVLDG